MVIRRGSDSGTDTRAGSVLLGAALAAACNIWGAERRRRGQLVLESAGIAGAVALVVAWSTVDGQTSALYRGGFLLVGVAAALVIAASVQPDRLVLGRLLSWRPLCWLGLVSYGVYLWHWPVDVVVTERRIGVGGWLLFAVQCSVTLVIAVASYVLLELPIRRGAGTKRQWWATVPAAGRCPRARCDREHREGVRTSGGVRDRPTDRSGSGAGRRVGTAHSTRHGHRRFGRRLRRSRARSGTGPGSDGRGQHVPRRVCAAVGRVGRDLHQAARDTSESAELRRGLVGCADETATGRRGHVRLGRGEHDARSSTVSARRPCDAPWEDRLREDLAQIAGRVQGAGARFVVTTYPPTAEDTRTAAARRGVACINAARRAAAPASGSQLADLARYVCPRPGVCTTDVEDSPLRPDGVHFTGRGRGVGCHLDRRRDLAARRADTPG